MGFFCFCFVFTERKKEEKLFMVFGIVSICNEETKKEKRFDLIKEINKEERWLNLPIVSNTMKISTNKKPESDFDAGICHDSSTRS